MNFSKLGWLLLILPSCYFPQEEFINPHVFPPSPIQTSIEIADITEPFALVFTTEFKFTLDRKEKQHMSSEVLRDGQSWIIGGPENVSFTLDPTTLSDGVHEFTIKVKLSSGSGSIAEILGAEYYLIEKKFIVTVDKTVPNPVEGLLAEVIDGRLIISWDKPDHDHFVYKLRRKHQNEESSFSEEWIQLNDASQTQYVDEGYTGGKIEYSVVLESSSFSVESESIDFELIPFEAEATVNNDGHVKIKWTEPFDFGDNIFIEVKGRRHAKIFPMQPGEAVVDTLLLGEKALPKITIYRNEYLESGYYKSFPVKLGQAIPKFDYFAFLPEQNKLILSKGYVYGFDDPSVTKLYRYDASTFTLEDSVILPGIKSNYALLVSENGKHGYIKFDENYPPDPRIIEFDPLDFSKIGETINVSGIYYSYFSNTLGNTFRYSIGNDNHLILMGYYYEPQVIDINMNSTTIQWYKRYIQDSYASRDGNLMIITEANENTVYKKVSDEMTDTYSWEAIGKVPGGTVFFSSGNYPLIIVSDNDNGITSIYDPQSTPQGDGYFQSVNSKAITTTGFDASKNYLIEEKVDNHISTMSLYDINDLTLVHSLKANVMYPYPDYRHYYVAGYQMITSGHIKKIE